MSLAALYDIHGNLPALEAVLAEVRRAGVSHLVVGGDVVPGPMPGECLERLRALDIPTLFIHGNGERIVLTAMSGGEISEVPEIFRAAIHWNAAQLDASTAAWMASWPLIARCDVSGIGAALFCHATPQNDTDIFTRQTPAEALAGRFAALDADLVVVGHTHMQFDRVVGDVRIVNAGSVGMSFQGPGAYWLEIGDAVRLRRTEYDLDAAAAAIRRTSYPGADEFAARNVLNTPDESAMLEAFSHAALRSPP
jgi:predicted phosphodiesterase